MIFALLTYMFIYPINLNGIVMENLTCVYLKTLSQKEGDNPRSTLLVSMKNKTYTLNLWDPWNDLASFLVPYDKLLIYNVDKILTDEGFYFSVGKKSIVVVEPDLLLNATSINNVSYCPRSYYLNEIVGDTISPYIAVRGSIVHNCLSKAITSSSKPSDNLSSTIDDFSLQYEYLGYTKEDVLQDLNKMAESLNPFVSSLTGNALPEILFLSPSLGIRGRIDLLYENQIYELKTAKLSDDDELRFSDLLQVTVYQYGVSNKIDEKRQKDGTVIYVGTNKAVQKKADPNWGLLRFAMQKRNLAYFISHQGYVPPILPESQHNKCRKCSVRHFCFLVCAGLEQERNCSKCPHNELCTQQSLPQSYMDYFNKFSHLIRLERNESSRNLSDLWKLSVEQRVAKGKAISDLKLESDITEKGRTQLLFSCDNSSEIREGDIAILSQGDVLKDNVSTGIVSRIDNNSIEIETTTTIDEISVVDLYSIDVGFRRQQRGIFNVIFKRNNFRQLIVEKQKPNIVHKKGEYIKGNSIQNQAVEKIIGTDNYCLIQGPAGTGKTYVIAKSAIVLAENKEKVLLTAFTNRAVDNICNYLLQNHFHNFVRLGSTHSIQPEIREYTLSSYKEKYPDKTTSEILGQLPIIVATTSTISNPVFDKLGIQTIIVDEASQMTEPTVLSTLMEGNRFVLVGDHKQLPPVVQNAEAQHKGMSISLFERLASAFPDKIHLLTDQYRMNDRIVDYSNKKYYEGKLKAFDNKISNQNLGELKNFRTEYQDIENSVIYDAASPLVFVPIEGIFQPAKKLNKAEAIRVAEIANNFLKLGINLEQLGIICPYRGQVSEVRRQITRAITVDTVDRFQGSDREIILLSLAETMTKGKRGFADERRLNVALTRAKKKLVVVGNPEVIEENLQEYINYLKQSADVAIETKPISKDTIKEPVKQEIVIIAEKLSTTAKILRKVAAKRKDILDKKEGEYSCLLCSEPIYENAIECPLCKNLFHIDHLLSWIKEKEYCPNCKTKLTSYS